MFEYVILYLLIISHSIFAYFLIKRDVKKEIEPYSDMLDPFKEIGELVEGTLNSPEAMAALIDRAVSTAVLTWKRSDGGLSSVDEKNKATASKIVEGAIREKLLPEINPILSMLVDGVFEYAGDWIGDSESKRSALWSALMKMASNFQGADLSTLQQAISGMDGKQQQRERRYW